MTAEPMIAALCYVLFEAYKLVFKSERAKAAIPLVAAIVGAALGALGYYFVEGVTFGGNAFSAAVSGMLSGLSATGANQIYKQMFCKRNEKEE